MNDSLRCHNTVIALVSDHPWCTKKSSLRGGGGGVLVHGKNQENSSNRTDELDYMTSWTLGKQTTGGDGSNRIALGTVVTLYITH